MRALLLMALVGCAGPDDTEPADTDVDTEPPPPSFCEQNGWTERAWVDADSTSELYAIASDVDLVTTTGEVRLSELWTGCESFLFVQHAPKQASGWSYDLWERDLEDLFDWTPDNVHYVFLSDDPEQMATLQDEIDDVLDEMDEADRLWWEERVHYIAEDPTYQDGWLGVLMTRPAWGIGIDRFQRLRFIGSYADPTRYDGSKGWFAPNIGMVANEAVAYNFESDRQDRLDADGATVVPAFQGEVISDGGWAGVRGYADIELPDAATMATFDTLELDLYLGCVGDGEYGDCPAWDYLVYAYLCDEADPDSCSVELGRWITTYHREGRWVHDVSALLPLLQSGGTRRLAFYTQQPYEVSLDLRLSNQGKEIAPVEATYLFSGAGFGTDTNTLYEPVTVAIPADAAKVEIAAVISGHGMHGSENCAEFCSTEHHFLVNGAASVFELEVGGTYGCMEQVAIGAVPNQYGTWWYGRNGWCPGMEVPVRMLDVTEHVTLGADNTFDYETYLLGGDTFGDGGANHVLASWVVVSR